MIKLRKMNLKNGEEKKKGGWRKGRRATLEQKKLNIHIIELLGKKEKT